MAPVDSGMDVRRFLRLRRDRAVGSILGNAESEIKPKLTTPQWESFRHVVLDALNSYHDTMLDLVRSDSTERNEYLISLLERLDRQLPQHAVAISDRLQEQRKEGIVRDQARFAENYGGDEIVETAR